MNDIIPFLNNLSIPDESIVLLNERIQYNYPNFLVNLNENIINPLELTNINKLEEAIFDKFDSKVDNDFVSGFLSVLFWGNVTRNYNFALNKSYEFLHEINAIGMPSIIYLRNLICQVKLNIEERNYSLAITLINTLPYFGISMSSKLLMFLNPTNIGVLDIHIARNITEVEIQNNTQISNKIKNVLIYEKYILWLNNILPFIKNNNGENYFQNVSDLERSLFQYFRNN